MNKIAMQGNIFKASTSSYLHETPVQELSWLEKAGYRYGKWTAYYEVRLMEALKREGGRYVIIRLGRFSKFAKAWIGCIKWLGR